MKLTREQEQQLNRIREKAKRRHERERKAARRQGRKNFPQLPYECSWAYEQEFYRSVNNTKGTEQ